MTTSTENLDSIPTFKRDQIAATPMVRAMMVEESIRLRHALALLECAHTTLEECAGDDRDSADPGITGPADVIEVAIQQITETKAALDACLTQTMPLGACEDCREAGALDHSWHE